MFLVWSQSSIPNDFSTRVGCFNLSLLEVDALLPYIQASETHEVYPVYSKLDYTMFTEEVKEHMKTKLPHVKNVVITGLEVCGFPILVYSVDSYLCDADLHGSGGCWIQCVCVC